MFSARSGWDLQPNPLSAALAARKAEGRPFLDLTESNPTKAGFTYPRAEILDALADSRCLVYEPQPAGLAEARAAVAARHGVSTEQVILTSGTSEAYAFLFKLLADPQDEVLVPRPSYPLFEYLAALESVTVRHYPLIYHEGWQIDLEALQAAVTPRTRAILLVNPNNPTGSFIKRLELAQLTALCRQRGLPLISDEVFAPFVFRRDPQRVESLVAAGPAAAAGPGKLSGTTGFFASAPGEAGAPPSRGGPSARAPLTFCLSGLSKLAGLPQLKCSWIMLGGEGWQEAAARLEVIADTYLTVGTVVQRALPRLLDLQDGIARQIRARLVDNLALLQKEISPAHPCRLLDVEGGWYATVRIPRTRSEEQWILELLERCDVLVHPGFFYDFQAEAYLVLSLLTEAEILAEGVRRLLAYVQAG